MKKVYRKKIKIKGSVLFTFLNCSAVAWPELHQLLVCHLDSIVNKFFKETNLVKYISLFFFLKYNLKAWEKREA